MAKIFNLAFIILWVIFSTTIAQKHSYQIVDQNHDGHSCELCLYYHSLQIDDQSFAFMPDQFACNVHAQRDVINFYRFLLPSVALVLPPSTAPPTFS